MTSFNNKEQRWRAKYNGESASFSLVTYGKYAKSLAEHFELTGERLGNWYEERDDYYVMYVYKKSEDKYYEVLLDKNNYSTCTLDDIKAVHWNVKPDGLTYYASGKLPGNTFVFLHRYILKPKNTEDYVDHKNGNGLDNRSSNIHITTQQVNNKNKANMAKNNIVGKCGINTYKDKKGNTVWRAQYQDKNKKKTSRNFNTKDFSEDVAKQLAIEARTLLEILDDNTKFDAEWKKLHPELF